MDEKWLEDFWYKFNIKPIKFKNKSAYKVMEFKIKQENTYKAQEIIDDVIQYGKNYFNIMK